MRTRIQFARDCAARAVRSGVFACLVILLFSCCAASARAGDAPSGTVGRIEGPDVSVEGGVGGGSSVLTPILYVSNGSNVTVHSGKAHMAFFAGGRVQICGPAKFTVLLSGDAITLALNFGRLHVELPAKTTLRIFTPTIIGTPIDISGGARDLTVGLSQDDSLCVLATSGAIQLEQQLSGEKIIVPEAGEFFLNAGQLLPVAGKPGTCLCLSDEPITNPHAVIPEYAIAAESAAPPKPFANKPAASQPVPAPAPVPNPSPAPAIVLAPTQPAAPVATKPDPAPVPAQPEIAEPVPTIQYGVLQHANVGHPVSTSTKTDANTVAPPISGSAEESRAPSLEFATGTPLPPPGPPGDTAALMREVRVSPEWQFTGHVEPPEFAAAMQHALGEKQMTASPALSAPAQPPPAGKKKKGGFWAALKRAFGGSS
jgi:hypothetical protein